MSKNKIIFAVLAAISFDIVVLAGAFQFGMNYGHDRGFSARCGTVIPLNWDCQPLDGNSFVVSDGETGVVVAAISCEHATDIVIRSRTHNGIIEVRGIQ